MADAVYVLDTSVVIDLKINQPRDIFEGVWGNLDQYVQTGRILVHRMMVHELAHKGKEDDDAGIWIQSIPDDLIIEIDDAQGAFINQMGDDYKYLADRLTKVEYSNSADPFLVALARLRHCTVVTNENAAAWKIPDLCRRYKIEAVNAFTMMRHESWKF